MKRSKNNSKNTIPARIMSIVLTASLYDVGTALSVGSIALGFIPGIGAVAIAADVVDLAYGLGQDDKINQATEQLANTIYKDSSKCIDGYITSIFNSLKESQQSTENNIKKIFNDEF